VSRALGADSHILVTGGTGFFGRALLRHWAAQPVDLQPHVTVVTRSPRDFLATYPEFGELPWLGFHPGDIRNPESLPGTARYSHVVHAAADSTRGAQLVPMARFEQIVDGTRHLLTHAERHGIPRFLFVSSGAVYGPQPPEMVGIPEHYLGMPDPLDGRQVYGVAKRSAELLCTLYGQQYGLEIVIARCFSFAGRDLPTDVHFAVGNFLRDALRASPILVHGNGSPVRSYMDQRDLAKWLTVLLARGRSGEAYNVGSDQAITVRDLAYLVRDTVAPDQPVRCLGDPDRQGTRDRYVPSITKAQEELGLVPQFTLEETLREAAHHLRRKERPL